MTLPILKLVEGLAESAGISVGRTGPKRVVTAAGKALTALDKPECAALFGFDSLDAEAIFSSLIQNSTMIGGIKSPSGTTISATTQGTTLVTANGTFNGAEITINDVAGTFVTGTLNDQIVTLLHEFGMR